MAMKIPPVSEIAKDTYVINEFGLTAMYLLVGFEKALLLDTGCGLTDLPALLEKLTDKPIMVALTHGHLDHVGGIGQFDEIYLHPADFEMASVCNTERMRGYVENLGKMGSYEAFGISPEMIIETGKLPEMKPLQDGDVIDLGQRKIQVIHVPGHTPGGLCFLDESVRILFSGDACNTNLLAQNTPVSETQRALMYLQTFTGRYDRMWNGHVGYAGNFLTCCQPSTTLSDLLTICEKILDGSAQPIEFPFLGRKMCAFEYGVSRISYNPENL